MCLGCLWGVFEVRKRTSNIPHAHPNLLVVLQISDDYALRLCRKRIPDKTKHLIDVLVTQHAKWIASRLRRALFGQSTSSAVASQQSAQLTKPAWKATSAISTAQRTQNNCGHMKRLKAAFSNFPCSVEATKVGTNVGQNGGVFPPSPQ